MTTEFSVEYVITLNFYILIKFEQINSVLIQVTHKHTVIINMSAFTDMFLQNGL